MISSVSRAPPLVTTLTLRQIVRTIGADLEVEILRVHISRDHVHLFVSCPPHVSASYLAQRLRGKSSRKLMQEYSHLKKHCWGRHLWARGFFVARSENVTDEVIMEYIRTQEMQKDDDDFRVSEEEVGPSVGLSADGRTHQLPAGVNSIYEYIL